MFSRTDRDTQECPPIWTLRDLSRATFQILYSLSSALYPFPLDSCRGSTFSWPISGVSPCSADVSRSTGTSNRADVCCTCSASRTHQSFALPRNSP
eukprot:scaffold4847_cov89-Cylindrotheca_fusiformis.AAC.3